MGRLVLVTGPNGSGKTSLLRHLAGLPVPGRLPELPGRIAVTGPLGWVPQHARDALVGLTVGGEFRMRRHAVPTEWARTSDQPSATLSAGEARRLALAPLGPGTWLLDEPFCDLDPSARDALIARIAAHDGTIVVADHTGLLDGMAEARIDLGRRRETPWPPLPPATGPPVIEADAAEVHGRRLPAVSFGPGVHAITGANGSGKTSLLRRLAGLGGDGVRIDGHAPRPGVDTAWMPEDPHGLFLRSTVADELGAPSPFVPADLMTRHPLTLSRGEAQRVALAVTLGRPAPVVLLDEPEAHLDTPGRAALARALAAPGRCIIMATHDERLAAHAHTRTHLEDP